MSSVTLYNKWRSRTFADPADHPLVGQDHVTRTLRNAVAGNQIAHAYLFCGPRGTGKTSAARILARAVNCRRGLRGEPCNDCENCRALLSGRQLDLLIEIDGASNRGVDDVRQLRERIMQRPGGADLTGRYKVYIIDEVHMLTQEAFNALLKSLEEPPPHVIFILATTDPQKVPPTVASRCQRLDFRPIALETLVGHLHHIAEVEGVHVEPAALELLARAAAGGARDAISLLDQALAYAGAAPAARGAAGARITASQVQAMLGLTDFGAVCGLLDCLVERSLPSALQLVQEVVARGSDLRQFTRQVLDFLRAAMLIQSGAGALLNVDEETRDAIAERARRLALDDTVRLIKLFSQAEQGLKSPAAQPQLPLELAVVEALLVQTSPPGPLSIPMERGNEGDGRTGGRWPGARMAEGSGATGREVVATPNVAAMPAPMETTTAPTETLGTPPDDDTPWPAESPIETRELPENRPVPVPAGEWPSQRRTAATESRHDHGVPAAPAPRATASVSQTRQAPRATVTLDMVQRRWPAFLQIVKAHSRMIEALLRDDRFAKPIDVVDGNVVVLQFRLQVHYNKVQDVSNQIAVQKALGKALGVTCKVRCVLAEEGDLGAERSQTPALNDDPVVVKAQRIWGAKVLSPEDVAAIDRLPEVPLSSIVNEKE